MRRGRASEGRKGLAKAAFTHARNERPTARKGYKMLLDGIIRHFLFGLDEGEGELRGDGTLADAAFAAQHEDHMPHTTLSERMVRLRH